MPDGPEYSGSGIEAEHVERDVLLTNGNYSVLVTPRGTGFSALGDQLLTAWSGDRLENCDGFFLYIRDVETGEFWRAGSGDLPPAGSPGSTHSRPGALTVRRTGGGIESTLEICVDPGRDAELRRITLANMSGRERRIEITSCAGVVLTDRGSWLAHPAFCRLFVQTGYDREAGALLAWRRPRSPGERHPFLAHAVVEGAAGAPIEIEYETDRARFVGRGHDMEAPAALLSAAPLSRTTGNVLDPIVSLRRVVPLAPQDAARVTFAMAAAAGREPALAIIRALTAPGAVDIAFRPAAGREEAGDV